MPDGTRTTIADLVRDLLAGVTADRVVVGVDGRSAAGKSTLAGLIAAELPGAAVVHTDDIAWWHSRFGWADLLLDGVLAPFRRGEAVAYRPPPWDERGREGAVVVPAGTTVLVVEGVGAGQAAVAPHLDRLVVLDTPDDVADERDRQRLLHGETGSLDEAGVAAWMAEERPFLAAERPWERADLVVGDVDLDRRTARVVTRR